MTTVYDVPANLLIPQVAKQLRAMGALETPEWAAFVKTGITREKPPVEADWWDTRVAAVLRFVYLNGPVGTEKVREQFGGAQDRGSLPTKAKKGSGSVARKALQQLEAAGLIESQAAKGRVVTGPGRSLLDNAAHAVRDAATEIAPGLAKY